MEFYLETPALELAAQDAPSFESFLVISKLYTFTRLTIQALLRNSGYEVLSVNNIENKHMQVVAKKGNYQNIMPEEMQQLAKYSESLISAMYR